MLTHQRNKAEETRLNEQTPLSALFKLMTRPERNGPSHTNLQVVLDRNATNRWSNFAQDTHGKRAPARPRNPVRAKTHLVIEFDHVAIHRVGEQVLQGQQPQFKTVGNRVVAFVYLQTSKQKSYWKKCTAGVVFKLAISYFVNPCFIAWIWRRVESAHTIGTRFL